MQSQIKTEREKEKDDVKWVIFYHNHHQIPLKTSKKQPCVPLCSMQGAGGWMCLCLQYVWVCAYVCVSMTYKTWQPGVGLTAEQSTASLYCPALRYLVYFPHSFDFWCVCWGQAAIMHQWVSRTKWKTLRNSAIEPLPHYFYQCYKFLSDKTFLWPSCSGSLPHSAAF